MTVKAHVPWTTTTTFTPTPMNAPLADLDSAIGFGRGPVVWGEFYFSEETGILSYPDGLAIVFTNSDGNIVINYVDSGSNTLDEDLGGVAYIDLDDNHETVVPVEDVAIPWEAESPLHEWNRLILGMQFTDGKRIFVPSVVMDLTVDYYIGS